MSTLNICIVNNILYAILCDMINIASDSRLLRHINNAYNEMNHHGYSRALRRIKNAANQRYVYSKLQYCQQYIEHNMV